MSDRFSEDDIIAAVPRLTRTRLIRYIEAEVVIPLRGDGGYVFRQIDIARLELLCDLSEDFELDETALGVVVSLIDQLHAARQDLRAIARAIQAQPPEFKARIESELRGNRE